MQWILIWSLTSDLVWRKLPPISFDPALYFACDNESNRRYWLAGQLSCHCHHLMCHGEQLNCQKSLKDSLQASLILLHKSLPHVNWRKFWECHHLCGLWHLLSQLKTELYLLSFLKYSYWKMIFFHPVSDIFLLKYYQLTCTCWQILPREAEARPLQVYMCRHAASLIYTHPHSWRGHRHCYIHSHRLCSLPGRER